MAKKKTKRKKNAARKSAATKRSKPRTALKRKAASKRRSPGKSKRTQRPRGRAVSGELVSYETRGLGARSAGQSGDTQGLAARPDVDSESVEELLEEGQAFEAEVVDGVENVPDPDQGEVRTREVEEDDVPEEYRDKDNQA